MLAFAALLCVHSGSARRADAVALEVVINDATGEVFLKNPTAAFETLDGYSLLSPGGSFLPTAWTTVADNYDLSADQSVDAAADWFVISQTTGSLAELSTTALSGGLDAGEIVSLGAIWNVGDLPALAVTLSAGTTTTDSFGDFRDLTADYDNDLDVDLDDLAVYSSTIGSTTMLAADGNGDGVIDAADYTAWRDSPELSLGSVAAAFTDVPPLLPPIAVEVGVDGPTVSAVPEPAGLALLAIASFGTTRRRRDG